MLYLLRWSVAIAEESIEVFLSVRHSVTHAYTALTVSNTFCLRCIWPVLCYF